MYTYRELCQVLTTGFVPGDAYDTRSRQPFTFGARRLTIVAQKPAQANKWMKRQMDIAVREFQESDLEHILRWRNNPEVDRYLTSRHRTREEIATWYKQLISDHNSLLCGIYCDGALGGYCLAEG